MRPFLRIISIFFNLILISERFIAKRRREIRTGDFSSAIRAICFRSETNSCVKNNRISIIFHTNLHSADVLAGEIRLYIFKNKIFTMVKVWIILESLYLIFVYI